MKCKNCGKEVSKDDLFCQYCGAKQESDSLICPKCGAQNDPTSKFCFSCGGELTKTKSKAKKITPKKEEPKEEIKKENKPEPIKEEPLDQTIMYTAPLSDLEEPKKKKTGLIIGISAAAVCFVLLIIFVIVPAVKGIMLSRNAGSYPDEVEIPSELFNDESSNSEITDDTSSNVEEKVVAFTYFELEAIDNVRVRSDSTTESDQVGKIAKGSTIRAYGTSDQGDGLTWYYLNSGEWVANDGSFFKVNNVEYKDEVESVYGSIGKINVTKETSIYDAPSKSAGTIGWLTKTTKVLYYNKVDADGKTWLQISGEGYVPLDCVEYYYK